MTVKITYFVHGTTTDNTDHKASGWQDVELSELGIQQSKELINKIKDKKFDVVFCSDLKRAIGSAELTFEGREIIQDERLRECNYGDYTQADGKIVNAMMKNCINKPFPNGESYKQVEERIRSFLLELKENHDGKHVAIVAHRAPQLALDVILKGMTWEQAMNNDWRLKQPKEWKPGWDYELDSNKL